ncbi:MAG TPA: DMT family transporter [Clostridiales bacterium]|nr:DMT family transporter [Clostridiales bacterium]
MKKSVSAPVAHIMALFTITVWGTTFIASKILLAVYSPLQIMLIRFFIAYILLWILRPKRLRLTIKEELGCVVLGLSGCTLYFLAENYALTFTLASNVSILITAAPILTAILAHFILPNEKLNKNIFIGFFIAMAGVALVVFNGTVVLKLKPIGDFLTLTAALCWAVYSVFLKQYIKKYDSLLLTRRVMLWGLITSLPVELIRGESFSLAPLTKGTYLFCILFLGILGSGLCYVMWNMAIHRLGTVTTNNYIYITPFATLIAARIIIEEPVSWMGIAGSILILLGVFLSDKRGTKRQEAEGPICSSQ